MALREDSKLPVSGFCFLLLSFVFCFCFCFWVKVLCQVRGPGALWHSWIWREQVCNGHVAEEGRPGHHCQQDGPGHQAPERHQLCEQVRLWPEGDQVQHHGSGRQADHLGPGIAQHQVKKKSDGSVDMDGWMDGETPTSKRLTHTLPHLQCNDG